MKKLFVVLLVLLAAGLFAQQKFAVVIGNGSYSNVTKLNNPVNDADDIARVLEYLGFTVTILRNGNLEAMETAVLWLRDRLLTGRSYSTASLKGLADSLVLKWRSNTSAP